LYRVSNLLLVIKIVFKTKPIENSSTGISAEGRIPKYVLHEKTVSILLLILESTDGCKDIVLNGWDAG
jgi:hypothetical protein